jgi:hypothetical protein
MSTADNDVVEHHRAAQHDHRDLHRVGTDYYDADDLPDLADVAEVER